MASNTSLGRAAKGSQYWIQTLVNEHENELSKAIRDANSYIGNITWISPFKDKEGKYRELGVRKIIESACLKLQELGFKVPDLPFKVSFWPSRGPQWDGAAIDDRGNLLLVEAKSYTGETKSKCRASGDGLKLIKKSMENAHKVLTTSPEYGIENSHTYNQKTWLKDYYQLGNRLAFLVNLPKELDKQNFNIKIKLILLNFTNDSTHNRNYFDKVSEKITPESKSTSQKQFAKHYEEVFQLLLGTNKCPNFVKLVYFDVG